MLAVPSSTNLPSSHKADKSRACLMPRFTAWGFLVRHFTSLHGSPLKSEQWVNSAFWSWSISHFLLSNVILSHLRGLGCKTAVLSRIHGNTGFSFFDFIKDYATYITLSYIVKKVPALEKPLKKRTHEYYYSCLQNRSIL